MHEFVEFHFLRPYWLVGILCLVPALYTVRQRTIRGNKWKDAIDPELLSVLISPSDIRSNLVKLTLAAIGFVLAFIALSGPTWERKPSPVERQNDPLVVILDFDNKCLSIENKFLISIEISIQELQTIANIKFYRIVIDNYMKFYRINTI